MNVSGEAKQSDIEAINGPDCLSASYSEGFDNLTGSYIRLTNLPTYPLDRLSYECTLWRQARQTLFALQTLDRSKPRGRTRSGPW